MATERHVLRYFGLYYIITSRGGEGLVRTLESAIQRNNFICKVDETNILFGFFGGGGVIFVPDYHYRKKCTLNNE